MLQTPSQLSMLRQMRDIVRAGQNYDAEHPHRVGLDLLNKSDFGGAAAAFREAIRLNPDFAFSHHGLGEALFNCGENSEAETAFARSIELNPYYAPSHSFLGELQAAKSNALEAEKFYRQALELDSENIIALKGLAKLLVKNAGILQAEAADLLKKAYRSSQEDTDILGVLLDLPIVDVDFCLSVGERLAQDNFLQKAVFFYRTALRLRPDDKAIWLKLANVLQDLGNKDAVAECVRYAQTITENTAETFELSGNLLTKQESLTEAIAACRRASELNPTDAQLHKKIGDLLARQNQLADACVSYKRALELGFETF